MNLAVLKAEARAVAQRQQTRLQKAIDEDRDLTAEEETADADDKAKLARLTTSITLRWRRRRLSALRRGWSRPRR